MSQPTMKPKNSERTRHRIRHRAPSLFLVRWWLLCCFFCLDEMGGSGIDVLHPMLML